MPPADPDRRAFLTTCLRKPRVLTVSCERLYMRHMEARRVGRQQEFLVALTAETAAADLLQLIDEHWLDREEFRRDVEPILRRRQRGTPP